MEQNKKIRIAIQSSGRLKEGSRDFLAACGLDFPQENGRALISSCSNANAEILYLRQADIPEFITSGTADYGIIGENTLVENGAQQNVLKKLNFGFCKLVIAVPQSTKIKSITQLQGLRIATSYPRTVQKFLDTHAIEATIVNIRGSAEITPSLGLADAICDITQTGKTLEENNLIPIETILESQAVLVEGNTSDPTHVEFKHTYLLRDRLQIYYYNRITQEKKETLCLRESYDLTPAFTSAKDVLADIKKEGDIAVKKYTKKFDRLELEDMAVSAEKRERACAAVPEEIRQAFQTAAANIEKYHHNQLIPKQRIETMPGVICFNEMRSIETAGLYIPGGTAPLPSSVLMLGIPAKIAGVKNTVLCSPPQTNGEIADIVLYVAELCGITSIYKIGGSQAIAAMGYGTETVTKADKIFGPGNQYVTAAKMLLALDPEGAAIDLPAGPTEVLIIADKKANAAFVAADLISQAEHDINARAILVCTDKTKVAEILAQVDSQLKTLPRKKIATEALENSFALIVDTLEEAFDFANRYAPEHLVLSMENAEDSMNHIQNAGSVFLGPYSCVTAGDYGSGTNHTLPTYGWARSYSGVNVMSFQKQISFQQLTAEGARNLAPAVMTMARQEKLEGHRIAMQLRAEKAKMLSNQNDLHPLSA